MGLGGTISGLMANKSEDISLILKTSLTVAAQYGLPFFHYLKNNTNETGLPFEEMEIYRLIQESSLPPILIVELILSFAALFITNSIMKDKLRVFSHIVVLAGLSYLTLHGLPDTESLKQVYDEQQMLKIEQIFYIYFPIAPLLCFWISGKLNDWIQGVIIPKKAKH